jgi:hypothetical protein
VFHTIHLCLGLPDTQEHAQNISASVSIKCYSLWVPFESPYLQISNPKEAISRPRGVQRSGPTRSKPDLHCGSSPGFIPDIRTISENLDGRNGSLLIGECFLSCSKTFCSIMTADHSRSTKSRSPFWWIWPDIPFCLWPDGMTHHTGFVRRQGNT